MPVISPSAFAPPAAISQGAALPPLLREQVRRLERAHSAERPGRSAAPLGLPEIDRLLPDGGLLTGALHEIEAGPSPSGRVAPHDGAALGFTAFLLGRLGPGTLLWCRQPSGTDAPLYAPALAAWFDPARLLMVTARRDEDLFWAMEEGLRTPGIAAVVGECAHSHAQRAADTANRRLSLAAEKNGVPALLLRPQPAPPQSVCATRWRVASAPSVDLTQSRWQVDLRRNRFGTPSAEETPSWLLEWNDETRRLAVVSQAQHGSAGAPQRQRLVG
ncbi:MAG TPA: damage-inducible mutagenesis protein [Reyranella sp.]|jgi:protein ImuA